VQEVFQTIKERQVKTTTVVEFTKKEIQDMLVEKARQSLTAGFSSSAVSFDMKFPPNLAADKDVELVGAKVTFENLQVKNGK
jgi:hypothetical protein